MPVRLAASRSTAAPSGTTHRIEIDEWEARDFWLPASALTDLTRYQGKAITVQTMPSGATRLTAGSYVGRLRLGTVDLILRPKRPIPTLLTLLAEVHELTRLVAELAGYHTTPEIVDLIVHVFLRQVDDLVRRGLKRTYVSFDEELVPVRGRMDVQRTFALHLRGRPRVWCSFEEFTLDGVENRALLATLLMIAANGSLLQARRRVAHKLTADFGGVSQVRMLPQDIQSIACDRLSAHYEPVLRLAQVILASMGLANDFGGLESSGFLVNMNTLFERFIYRRLSQLLSRDRITVRPQPAFWFDEEQQAEIRPDLVIRSPHGRRIVADTKYKIMGKTDRADLYQILAYCRVLRVSHGILITVGDRGKRLYSVRDGETTIDVVPVALDRTVAGVHSSVGALADWIRDRLHTSR